jgi:hypothetical protein
VAECSESLQRLHFRACGAAVGIGGRVGHHQYSERHQRDPIGPAQKNDWA